jgi:DNA-binding CsgD family transcriptional regulator/PAS domain-containing protein
MSLDARMLAMIEAFYEAAMDEARWAAALQELARLTDSQVATFWVLDGSAQPRLPTFTYINLDPAFVAEYLQSMTPHDPTVQYLVRHPDEPIVHDGLVITEREKDRHPYYDWHARFSDTRFRLVGQARLEQDVQAGVALHRTRKAGRFEPVDLDKFALLYRHLRLALQIGFRLGSLGAMEQCTAELLDRNPAAILLLDSCKRVIFVNRAAHALQADNDGVRLTARGVTLAHKSDHDRLESLVAQALRASSGGAMRALRPSGRRPYGIFVSPVSGRYSALAPVQPAVCLVITDPDRQTPTLENRLLAAFGLTEAEARLAALLASGEKLRSAADKLNITYGTARARLARIFQKTETRRQGELVKVLLMTLVG